MLEKKSMSRLSKNILYNLFGQIGLLVLSFAAVKFIYNDLGEDALGIIYFTITLSYLLSLMLEMGICTTSTREVAAFHESEPKYIYEVIRTGSAFYWGSFFLISFLIYFTAPIIVEKWIILKSLDKATATSILRILGISSFVALPSAFYTSLIKGLQRMEFNNLIDVTIVTLRQSGTILILYLAGNIYHVVYWMAFCFALSIIIYVVILCRFFRVKSFVPRIYLSVIKRTIGFAKDMTLLSIFWGIYKQADKIIISKFMQIGLVGYYNLAQRVVSLGTLLSQAIRGASFPAFSALYRENKHAQIVTQYNKLQDIILFGNIPLLTFIPFAALPVFSIILNEEIAEMLMLPIVLLCIGAYMDSTLRIPVTISLAVDKPEIAKKANLYSLIIMLPLSILLIYNYGLVGAGLAIITRMIFFFIYAVPKIYKECLQLPIITWYQSFFKVIGVAMFSYGLCWTALAFMNNYSIPALLIAYISGTIIFAINSYLVIGPELKGHILSFVYVIHSKITAV